MKLLAPACSWPGVSRRTWVAARMFFSMSSVKYAQQGPQGHACAVRTTYSLNHVKQAWQKVACKFPTSWPVCSTPLRSRLSTWWLNWVQKHPAMPPSMLAPASQVRRTLHLSPKISSTSVSDLIFGIPELCLLTYVLCPFLSYSASSMISLLPFSEWAFLSCLLPKELSLAAGVGVYGEELLGQKLPWRRWQWEM